MVGKYDAIESFLSDYQIVEGRLQELRNSLILFQDAVGRGVGGRELALAKTKLDEARMWLNEARDMAYAETEGPGKEG